MRKAAASPSRSLDRLIATWPKALVLLGAAHAAPWAAAYVLGGRLAAPMDAGLTFNGRRLLGDHKTWRGVIAATVSCALAAALLGYSVRLGVEFAALSVAGDATSSLIKRRLSLAPGTEIPGLDQIPEALAPLLTLSGSLGIGTGGAFALAVIFALVDLVAMPLRRAASWPDGWRNSGRKLDRNAR